MMFRVKGKVDHVREIWWKKREGEKKISREGEQKMGSLRRKRV